MSFEGEPEVISPTDEITYTVVIANAGESNLSDVAITSVLPTDLDWVAGSGVGFTYSAASRKVSWKVETLTVGEVVTGSFRALATGYSNGEVVILEMQGAAETLATPSRPGM
ncbi:MAG: hypothetical protein ACRDIB_03725 [Ardenticatenaceae bacterium]